MSSNQLNDISKVYMEAVYGGGKKEEKDTRMVVTNADKKANTKAYQNYKAGSKAYKAADHLKDNYEFARHKASVISRGGRLEDAVESWNQKVAHQEAMNNVSEKKEVNVKDTYKTVAAIVDYDRAKKGSKDATYDSMKGDKEGAKKERDYAAWERSKMKKDDPNWKSKKYHTGMHGEGKMYGYSGGGLVKKKKKKHDCASKVKHEEYGIGNCIPEMHDLDESGNVSHYDVEFAEYIVEGVPAEELEILEGHMHEHVIREKMAAKDYDGDGKIESGKDEYFGSKDKAIKKAMGKKMKKESLSDWRDDLSDLIEIVAEPEERAEKEVTEKKVKNKVVINPKFTEAVEEMGGELLEMVEVTEEYAPEIEAATEYFYAEGINEEGLDAIIEEVGLDTFVDFVIDSAQDLNEERSARKMSARNLQTLKKKTIPAAKEAEAKRQKEKKGEYSAAYKKKETDVTVYDKAKAKAKAKPAAKKVAAVTKQVKKLQPAKKASKQGIGDKIRGAITKGVARHQAARAKGREPEKRVKEFGKGFASGVKGAVKFAGKVKKVVSEEGKVKKEIGYLSKAVKTMKGKNVAKADAIEEGKGKKNCGCGQDPCITYGKQEEGNRLGKSQVEESYDQLDNDLLEFVENTLGNFSENEILDMMESMYHRRNPGKKHPLESGSSKVKRRPVSDAEKKSTDKSDRMYVAMRRVKDRQKGYDRDKSDAADRLHSTYTDRQSKRKKGASSKEASAQSHGEFGSKGFRVKRGGRSGVAPETDRGTGNKAARRAGKEVRDTRK